MTAALLKSRGVCDAVVSPGSRNAPIILALSRVKGMRISPVVDERSAAFIALGMSLETGKPTAVVCTSGSAVLNFAPAVAEAYYRNVPLFVISADRPKERIDQADSQTIRQAGILDHITESSYDIPTHTKDPDNLLYINRLLNEAIIAPHRKPVHINIQLADELNEVIEVNEHETFRVIDYYGTPMHTPTQSQDIPAFQNAASRVLIVVGSMNKNNLSGVLTRLAALPDVEVVSEPASNVGMFQYDPDFEPDIVISVGGSIVSAELKRRLRSSEISHWAIDPTGATQDTYDHLAGVLAYEPEVALESIYRILSERAYSAAPCVGLHYGVADPKQLSGCSMEQPYSISAAQQWNDRAAVQALLSHLRGYNLHVSNGTAIRLVAQCDYRDIAVFCNRGVSGIDGCTSTAFGAALRSPKNTVLLSGDMSFQYDHAILASRVLPRYFKIAILNNSGGNIFRQIAATKDLDITEQYLANITNLPIQALAQAYQYDYYYADNLEALEKQIPRWLSSPHLAILEIKTR